MGGAKVRCVAKGDLPRYSSLCTPLYIAGLQILSCSEKARCARWAGREARPAVHLPRSVSFSTASSTMTLTTSRTAS